MDDTYGFEKRKSRLHLNIYLMLGLLFSSGCGIHSGIEITDSGILTWWWVSQRYTAAQIYKNDWFRKSYKPAQHTEKLNVTLEDINAVFNDSSVRLPNLPLLLMQIFKLYMCVCVCVCVALIPEGKVVVTIAVLLL
jgi:hypothetical protein